MAASTPVSSVPTLDPRRRPISIHLTNQSFPCRKCGAHPAPHQNVADANRDLQHMCTAAQSKPRCLPDSRFKSVIRGPVIVTAPVARLDSRNDMNTDVHNPPTRNPLGTSSWEGPLAVHPSPRLMAPRSQYPCSMRHQLPTLRRFCDSPAHRARPRSKPSPARRQALPCVLPRHRPRGHATDFTDCQPNGAVRKRTSTWQLSSPPSLRARSRPLVRSLELPNGPGRPPAPPAPAARANPFTRPATVDLTARHWHNLRRDGRQRAARDACARISRPPRTQSSRGSGVAPADRALAP